MEELEEPYYVLLAKVVLQYLRKGVLAGLSACARAVRASVRVVSRGVGLWARGCLSRGFVCCARVGGMRV